LSYGDRFDRLSEHPFRKAAALRSLMMTTPVKADVDAATQDMLAGLAVGDLGVLNEVLAFRDSEQASTGLDGRTFSLVKIAALIALDAPPASYTWQVANALSAGATPRDLIGVLRAVLPQVGGPRAMAAAPELMLALGLDLPDDL
jgi:4-carboxymuconolactone decarboxylase